MAVIGSLIAQLSLDSASFVRDLTRAGDSLDKAGRRMTTIGTNISTYVSAPLIGFGALALKTAGDFEEGMNRVAAVSGATAPELKQLRDEAQRLGASVEFGKFSARDAAEGMGFLGQAGFKTAEIIGAMPATLQLASAAQIDLAESADIVTNVLTGYGKTVDELGSVNDVLVKAFTSANVNLTQLGESMKFVGPLATAAGVDFEEAAAAIGLMGNAGIQAEMAGTSLRNMIAEILGPTPKAAKLMEELGLSFTDASGRILPLVEIVSQLEPHLEDAGIFIELFGKRAGPTMAALVKQGSGALSELTNELRNSAGTAAEVASIQMQGFATSLEGMKSSFEALQIAVAESGLLDFVSSLVQGLADVLQKMSEADPKILKFATVIGGAVAAGGPLLVFLGGAAFALGALITPIGAIVAAITGAAGIIAALVAFREEIGSALIGALTTAKDAFVSFGEEALGAVKDLVNGVTEWMGSRLVAAFDAVAAPIQKTVDLFRGMYEAVVGQSYVPDLIDEVGFHFRRLDDQMVGPATDAVQRTNAAFSKLVAEPFKNAIRGIQDSFTNMFEDIFSGGVDSFSDLADSIKRIFIRLAAEIATLMVIRPVLAGAFGGLAGGGFGGGVTGLGGLLGGAASSINRFGANFGFASQAVGPGGGISNFNLISPGRFGGQTLAGLLGAGATGAGIGALGGSLFGLSGAGTAGSSIGGGLGGALGSIIPGVGTLVGSIGGSVLGGIVGSLFKSKPSDKGQASEINFLTGVVKEWGQTGSKFSQENRDAATTFANSAVQLADTLKALTGGTLSGGLQITVGSRDALRLSRGGEEFARTRDPKEFISLITQAVASSLKGATGVQAQILKRADTSTPESLIADLEFGRVFEQLTRQARPLTDQLSALKEQFAGARAQARRLGLDVDRLKDAQRDAVRSFRQGLMTELRVLAGDITPASLALEELRSQFRAVKREAGDLGLNRSEIVSLQQRAVRQFRLGFLEELERSTGANETSGFAGQVSELNRQFAAAKETAADLGINMRRITDIQKRSMQNLRSEFLGQLESLAGLAESTQTFADQVDNLRETFAAARRDARALGISVVEIRQMEAAAIRNLADTAIADLEGQIAQQARAIREHFTGILDPLRDFRSSLDFGPLSANAPAQQFQLAQSQFQSLAAQAANNNAQAIRDLPSAAQAFIQQAMEFGASPAQAEAVAQVQRAFDRVISQQEQLEAEFTRDLPDAIDDAADKQVKALRQEVDRLVAALAEVRLELRRNPKRVA